MPVFTVPILTQTGGRRFADALCFVYNAIIRLLKNVAGVTILFPSVRHGDKDIVRAFEIAPRTLQLEELGHWVAVLGQMYEVRRIEISL